MECERAAAGRDVRLLRSSAAAALPVPSATEEAPTKRRRTRQRRTRRADAAAAVLGARTVGGNQQVEPLDDVEEDLVLPVFDAL